ncbi:phytoene desaturase family protein [Elongatibacter sediminis]|uniref:Pyridine nucleotide-disulfide oxidoreductase domain-containing protein 2 n=1 Tax=Elongatibacter sediminis TaxID=3119006 RepID=A0AAW9RE77_9GAMM
MTESTDTFDHIIVGSGINSLVCAALLARRGDRILLLERNDRLGGCIRTEELTAPGFIHDVLSNWHPLFVTSPAYAELKDDLEKYGLEYCNTDRPTAAILPDQSYCILKTSREENVANFNALSAGDGDRYQQSLSELEQSLDLTFTLLGNEFWRWGTAKVFLAALIKRGPVFLSRYFASCLENGRNWLERDFNSEAAAACFATWPAHTGMSPDATTSGQMARIIAFTLEMAGCPVVKGGGFRLVQAFEQLIRAHDGAIRLNADVVQVRTEDGRATGVELGDGTAFHATKSVICSTTPAQLYQRLLDPAVVPEPIAQQTRAFRHGRADMQIHLALDAPPEWVQDELGQVAIVHVTPGLNGVSRAMNEADRGLLPAEGTVVVGQPAALDPSRVPEGKGLLWIQLQELPPRILGDAAGEIDIPPDGNWTESVREAYADRIVDRLGNHIRGLREHIIARTVLSPADLESLNINLVGGDPYGGECSLDQNFLWRPLRGLKNHETPIRNLYHIGASTHPGPGLGGGSGYLVAKSL